MRKFFLLPAVIVLALFVVKFPSFAVTPVGNYLVLNGGHVKVVSSASVIPPSFSFNASIKPNSVAGKQIILSIGDKGSGKRYYEIGINGGLLTVDYDYNGSRSSVNAGNLEASVWQDIAVEITSGQTKLFIDGKEVFAPFLNNNLGPVGPNIVLGDSYKESFVDSRPFKGLMDEVSISGGSTILLWHLDETRGVTAAADSSGNNLNGILVGGDSLIHFFGVLPTPTPFTIGLPPIQWNRPVLPTLSFPSRINPFPTGSQPPSGGNPIPTVSSIRDFPRRTYGIR